MICEITNNVSFGVDDGSVLEGKFDCGVPVLCTGNYRFAQQARQFVFNELGLHCSQHVSGGDDDYPYVVVLRPKRTGGKVSASNVKAVRATIKALAVGLESHFLYKLD